jgi:two-component system, NarL family, response regulator
MTKARAARPAARARVLIADDHALMRNGVANLLNQEADLEVVAEAADGQRAVELFEEHRPDVALVDLRMPRLEGVEVVRPTS